MVIWDARGPRQMASHRLHHAKVSAVRVSPDDAYVVSAAGPDDKNAPYVVWDVNLAIPLCGE